MLDDFLGRLQGVTRSGEGHAALCPAHEDRDKSLTVSEAEDGRILAHCFKGCSFREVMEAVGLEVSDAFPGPIRRPSSPEVREFVLRDSRGNKVATHHRKDDPKGKPGKKKVWWTTEKGKGLGGLTGSSLPLWGSEAISSVPLGDYIVVVEGEKAAFYLTQNGIPALGTVTGAQGTPGEEVLAALSGRRVVLWPDNDGEGKAHMRRIARGVASVASEVRVYEWPEAPEKGDAADHPAVRRRDVEGLVALRAELGGSPRFQEKRDRREASSFEYLRSDYVRWLAGVDRDVTGIRVGIPEIDENILGLSPGRSYVIASPPGGGKSLLCGQIGLTAAYQGKRVLLHSIESSAMEYCQRMTTYMAGVGYFRAIRGKTSVDEQNLLMEQFEILSGLPFMVTDLGTQKPSYMRQEVERHEPDLVIVDYLQYATPDNPTGNAVQDLDLLSRQITSIKGDYNVPLVLAAQINRDTRHTNTEPQLHHLRGSGALEQDADVVMFLHRDNPDEKDDHGDLETRLLCRKNRIVKPFKCILRFAEDQQWFVDDSGRTRRAASPEASPEASPGPGPGVAYA